MTESASGAWFCGIMWYMKLTPAIAPKAPQKNHQKKRTYAELFLHKLGELAGKEQKLIGNKALRGAIGWDNTRYTRIRTELVAQNQIVVGRGQGGSVGLASAPGTKGLSVFVSYSHVDQKVKDELLKHLKPLDRGHLIETWHDGRISPGEEWDDVIASQLEKADIILLLVSIDFINSDYCNDVELERALDRHGEGKARVIPVILRACMWNTTKFAKLQAVPKEPRAEIGRAHV